MTWIQQFSGRAFDLDDPQPDQVSLEDIARSLAGQCRYTAHTGEWAGQRWRPVRWTVAEHSLVMAKNVPPDARMYTLLHDAHEAYIGDLATPIKWLMPPNVRLWWDTLAARVDSAIYRHFGIPPPTSAIQAVVKRADARMLATEVRQFMLPPPRPWGIAAEPYSQEVLTPRSTDLVMLDFATSVRREFERMREGE